MTYEEKVQALVDEGGFNRDEAKAMLEDMGEDHDDGPAQFIPSSEGGILT